jgi:hypothetical protein
VSNKDGSRIFSTRGTFYARYETTPNRTQQRLQLCFYKDIYLLHRSTLPATNQTLRVVATLLPKISRSSSTDTNQDENFPAASPTYSIYCIERSKCNHKEKLVIPGRWQPSTGQGFQGHGRKPWGSRAAVRVETQLVAGSCSHNGIHRTPWLCQQEQPQSMATGCHHVGLTQHWSLPGIGATLSASHTQARRCGSRKRRSGSREGHP